VLDGSRRALDFSRHRLRQLNHRHGVVAEKFAGTGGTIYLHIRGLEDLLAIDRKAQVLLVLKIGSRKS
jgi:hypothetical protein